MRPEAPSFFGPAPHPQLIVFDLDLTLWECGGSWCDCLTPPFDGEGDNVVDRYGARVTLYPDVNEILNACDAASAAMALASRTEQPQWARELLDRLGIRDRFAFEEIYPACKLDHFAALRNDSGVDYANMLFFDDERRNIVDVSGLGVSCLHVLNGMTLQVFRQGLATFRAHSPD